MSDATWPPLRRPLGPSGPLPAPPARGAAPAAPASAPVPAAVPAPDGASASVPLPPVVETGHAAVDGALARLAIAADVPGEARAEVYGEVHDRLRDTLAGLDERPAGPPSPNHLNR